MDSNDWYYISWWAMWIGHLVAYAPAAIMWIPSYFGLTPFSYYGYTLSWAGYIGMIVTLFVWTSLIVSGIEWDTWKEIWVVAVVYSIGSMVLGYSAEMSIRPAIMWYMGKVMNMAIEDECEGD